MRAATLLTPSTTAALPDKTDVGEREIKKMEFGQIARNLNLEFLVEFRLFRVMRDGRRRLEFGLLIGRLSVDEWQINDIPFVGF